MELDSKLHRDQAEASADQLAKSAKPGFPILEGALLLFIGGGIGIALGKIL